MGAARHLWRVERGHDTASTILPDGCLDLILLGERLAVAGPDPVAREHRGSGTAVGVRLSHGLGPVLLGVPADRLTGHVVPLDDLWSARAVRTLTDRVLERPEEALASWARGAEPDPDAAHVFAAAAAGTGVADIAALTRTGARTLHRRCRAAFGYGPQHLVRVLRLQRALTRRRAGMPWADVAADVGYADQPHLARDVRALTGRRPGELA